MLSICVYFRRLPGAKVGVSQRTQQRETEVSGVALAEPNVAKLARTLQRITFLPSAVFNIDSKLSCTAKPNLKIALPEPLQDLPPKPRKHSVITCHRMKSLKHKGLSVG
jgi:hypothetical protein